MPEHTPLKDDGKQLIQLVVFRAGNEEFCVPIEVIQEIIKSEHVTPIPNAPAFISGLINVRGDIVAIVDVKNRFGLAGNKRECKHIIITQQATGLFGLMVEEVIEVLRVNKTDVNPTPSMVLAIHEDYVTGVVVNENRLLILLDLARVLSKEELTKLTSFSHEPTIKLKEKAVNSIDCGNNNKVLKRKK